jgi:hypothetical protein
MSRGVRTLLVSDCAGDGGVASYGSTRNRDAVREVEVASDLSSSPPSHPAGALSGLRRAGRMGPGGLAGAPKSEDVVGRCLRLSSRTSQSPPRNLRRKRRRTGPTIPLGMRAVSVKVGSGRRRGSGARRARDVLTVN